jgi:uncharacterized membrane protein SpoIIM required for sporulation
MQEVRLRSSDFRREREAQWRELEAIVDRAERKGLASLDTDTLHRLPALYRAVASSLSVARAISLDRNLLLYLESLAARAYLCVYGVKPRTGDVISTFFKRNFPETVRRYRLGVIMALSLMLAGLAVGLAFNDPEAYYAIVPDSMAQGRSPTSSTESLRAVLYSGGDTSSAALGEFSSFLFTHNAKIGLFSFALGFALGLPSVILLFYNGLLLGAMAGLYAQRGLSVEFWAWLLPHGVTELLAVCLCGGAGLMMAVAVLRPGPYGRVHQLARTGREASLIVLGAVLMFLLAGLIEGFFRQIIHDVATRYALACVTFAFWVLYFLRCGKREKAS